MVGGFLYQDGGAAVKGLKKGGLNTPLFLFTVNEADFWCGIGLYQSVIALFQGCA